MVDESLVEMSRNFLATRFDALYAIRELAGRVRDRFLPGEASPGMPARNGFKQGGAKLVGFFSCRRLRP
jgi:hypothetical protein